MKAKNWNVKSLRLSAAAALVILLGALAPAGLAAPAADPAGSAAWTGEYFNNITLSDAPVLVRDDAHINFMWAEGTSPAPGTVNTDNYSVRWTRWINFAAGTWTFNTLNDDGLRLWVDDAIAVDAWYDQGPTSHSGSIALSAGWHLVRVEYYNRTLGGTAQVSYSLPGSYPDWKGEYFSNQSLAGAPTLTRNDTSINFNWGLGAPDPSLPADHFSVRWTRTVSLGAGTWRFTTTADDGVRVWVDGVAVIDKWMDQSPTTYVADRSLAAGNHTLEMDYYDNTYSAVAQLGYALAPAPPPPGGAWHGQYYANTTLSGAPVFVRDDPAVNFDWGAGSPNASVPADNFSAKWDSTQGLPSTGYYTVSATADDGVRVWVDGALVINGWSDHPPTTYTAVLFLSAGAHNFHVEYYEHAVNALVQVHISGGGGPPPPGGSDVIVDDGGPGWLAGGDPANWHGAGGFGGHSFWTLNNTFVEPLYNWGRWLPALPHAGNYEVFAYIPAGVGTTGNARYYVYHNGIYTLAARAQNAYANTWVSLGTYAFNAVSGEHVSLADVTGECFLCRSLVFDAVKFSPR